MSRVERERTRRSCALVMLVAILHLVVMDGTRAMVNEDYPGMSLEGRPSVAMVLAPGETFVNTFLGSLFHPREDFYIPSEGIPLDFTVSYNLIRGDIGNLAAAGPLVDLGPVSCVDLDSPDTQAELDPLVPAPGQAFFYLARVHHGLAPYGNGTGGLVRIPGPGDCPMAR